MASSGKLGVSSQTWTGSQKCCLEQFWCPTVPAALSTYIIAMTVMTLAFDPLLAFPGHTHTVWHAWHLSPITLWHWSLCCRMKSPNDWSQLQRQIQWAGNGNKLSRQDALLTRPAILWTHYPRNFKVSSDIVIHFWYHHHDRFKWVSHHHTLCMHKHTQIAWWVIWKTFPRLIKPDLLFLHQK